MSVLASIQEQLLGTNALLARLESNLAKQPASMSVSLEIKSLEKMKGLLEKEFLSVSESMGIDVCSYRIIPNGRLNAAGVAGVLGAYQGLVSVFYDAVTRGPRKYRTLAPETTAKTSLDYAYSFAGSAGFVFSVPNQRDLFGDSQFSESLELILEVSKAKLPEQVLGFARRLGPAPIRVLYDWAEAHVKASFSADIEWRSGQEVRQRTIIQGQEFRQLQLAISETSDEEVEETIATGMLEGADVVNKTFHFLTDDGADIKGHTGDVINQSHRVNLPNRYKVVIRTSKVTYYSTEQEKVRHDLLTIEPI